MSSSPSAPTLLVVGSGPGIGVTTASLFAARKFDKVALLSRDAARLAKDRETVLEMASRVGRNVEVVTWSVDITDTPLLRQVLAKAQQFGRVSCVLFNAAHVAPSGLFGFEEEEIVRDFMTTNIALYTTASWALPMLADEQDKPSFLVTSSLLWKDPIPQLFSLSMVKAAQRNLVLSLQKTYPAVHVALLNVGGAVDKSDKFLNPDAIAEKFWELYAQDRERWTVDLDVLG